MCGKKPTSTSKGVLRLGLGTLAVAVFFVAPANAQMEGILEEIIVTAQKREESLQDVPISVHTLQGESLNALFSGSEDILALSGRVPGLYAESSNGRSAPRFYMRGLGHIDFDLAASQPVSIIMDDVVMENAVLRGFPLFDVQNIEVIRGPQGTLFGRNTTAGIVKINTRRPSDEFNGYVKGSFADFGGMNIEGAVGGSLVDNKLTARASVLHRSRDNWITNGHTGEKSLGEFQESAIRLQFDWQVTDRMSALLSYQYRDLDGTSSIFRANVFTTGSAALNQNYDRKVVYYDEGDNNPQAYESQGTTLNLQWDFDDVNLTSITSFQSADGFSRGDIDGGVVNVFATQTPPDGLTWADTFVLCPFPCLPARTWPGEILIPSLTQDGADTDQFTQELRLASNGGDKFNWQIGAFYFSSDLVVETENFASAGFVSSQNTRIQQENKTWAVFGQGSYDLTDRLTLTGGVRYTDDEKDFSVLQFAQLWIDLGSPILGTEPVNAQDGQASWEVSANFALTDESSLYGRFSNGFRAQTIQGRDVAFEEAPSVADPETINSFEVGYKADLFSGRARINLGVFHYEVDDMQLSIIGGAANSNQVINSKKGVASGFELDADFLLGEFVLVSIGTSYNDTELKDADLATVPCGSGMCTPLDPVNPDDAAQVMLNGNPFPRAPKTTHNLNIRVHAPMGDGELYASTDWVWYGKINMPLYEAVEFQTDGQYEGGVRIGYTHHGRGLDIALFARNITDEDNVLGFIDFSNNTGFVNEPSVFGIEVGWEFGD